MIESPAPTVRSLITLMESVANQQGFEALAKAILDMMAASGSQEPFAFLGDAGKHLNWSTLSPGMQEFITERETLEISVRYADTGNRGFYRRNGSLCWVVLTLPKAAETGISGAEAKTIRAILNQRYTTLVHELTHAYDDWISDGRFSKQNTHAQSVTDYLVDPAEVNARFTQVVAALDLSWDWTTFVHAFKSTFQGWAAVRAAVQKRLVARLGAYYTAMQPKRTIDLSGAVKRLEASIRQKVDKEIALAYDRDANAIVVAGLSGNRTTAFQAMQAICRVADLFGKLVYTDQTDLTLQIRGLRFVRNTGQLPSDVKIFRIPGRR